MTEASLAGKLSHPHIAKIMDAVMEEEVNYVVMEYVEGGTLDEFTAIDKLLPVDKISEIAYKCCKALEYAQHQGVIHRDIKPANILMSGEDDIKISDFGAAALQSDKSTQVTGVGSPAYMSPEQVKEEKLTHQTDIYSLGVVMYKLLTGKLPFDASNNSSMIYNIINIAPKNPSTFRPDIPPEMDAIVKKAMAKDTAKRYQTWDEFANDLVGFSTDIVPNKKNIQDTEKFDKLRGLSFFNNFSDVELWEVLRLSVWSKVPESEYILREGESGRSFFILAKGTVKVMKDGRLLSLLRAGDCFGEMAHLLERDFKRSTDVIAKDDVVLIEISPDALEHATTGCRYQFSDAFLRMLVKRLSVANTRLSHLLADQG